MACSLDLDMVRAQFPAFDGITDASFFENAGGSFACRQTIDALSSYYRETKVQPYADYPASAAAGAAMDRSRSRWAEALGVDVDEVVFGPSTSMNTYVLAQAVADGLRPGDEIVVTNQDHEANTGAIRRMAARTGATVREWRTDPTTGLLDLAPASDLIGPHTRYVTMPHASNVVGQENDVGAVCAAAHAVGARVIVDGVSFAPHTVPDVAALGADVYLFSLYKTYSVHQGLMTVRRDLLDELPNQGHFFNADDPSKRLNPAGPDHAQVAASGAVLDYVELLDRHHDPGSTRPLHDACRAMSALWREHEDALTAPLLALLASRDDVRLIGPHEVGGGGLHRCPTVAFSPLAREPAVVARELVARGVETSSGHYYAHRVLAGLGLDPDRGVVRLSAVHYTSHHDVDRALDTLGEVLS